MRLFSLFLFTTYFLSAEELCIDLTSTSSIKQKAVLQAFEKTFPEKTIRLRTHLTQSLVPEQPVGQSQGLAGAQNRLKELLNSDADYRVSIENYIWFDQSWKDRAVVIVKKTEPSQEITMLTDETPIPNFVVEQAKKEQKTVGQVLSELYPHVNESDWHQLFGPNSRQQILEAALFKALHKQEIDSLKKLITLHPDFPKPGILFQDFTPILNNPSAFKLMIDLLAKRYQTQNIDVVVGLESRGFIIGSALAYKLGVSFTPVRKAGKLPGPVYTIGYEKEYGTDFFDLSQNAITKGQRVLIVDDLIATGGSAKAAIELIRLAEGNIIEFVSLLAIEELKGRDKLGVPSFNLID